MKLEPKFTFPAFIGTNQIRRQYVTTLPVNAIRRLAAPILSQKSKGAGLRQDRVLTRRIISQWDSSGKIESITPVVVAISEDHEFKSNNELMIQEFGNLHLPLSSILDICDGIQRIAALDSPVALSKNQSGDHWPVHLIEIHSKNELTTIRETLTERKHR